MLEGFKLTPAIESVITELEAERKKIVSSKLKGWGLTAFGLIAVFVSLSIAQGVIGLILGAALIIPGIVILYRLSNNTNQYKYRFKQEVVGAALSTVNQSLTFDHNKGISESEFVGSNLFTTAPDRYHTEDLITGKEAQTTFYFAEVHAEYKTETRTKSGRQVHWHDILKGIVFSADFNKNFNGRTVVRPKDFGASFGAWFTKNIFSFGDKDVVQLENEYFNKNFVTYSTDQIEARYILTPAMMDRISELNERSANCVSISFINSSLYIAFPLAKNYFEPPIFKTLLKPDLLDEDMNILNFMFSIIKELDLNTRIWTKS
jgi:hypothetical protein